MRSPKSPDPQARFPGTRRRGKTDSESFSPGYTFRAVAAGRRVRAENLSPEIPKRIPKNPQKSLKNPQKSPNASPRNPQTHPQNDQAILEEQRAPLPAAVRKNLKTAPSHNPMLLANRVRQTKANMEKLKVERANLARA